MFHLSYNQIPFMTYRRICCMCNMTGVTNGTGIGNHYVTTMFTTAEFVVDFAH
jgi:hypothetical protein